MTILRCTFSLHGRRGRLRSGRSLCRSFGGKAGGFLARTVTALTLAGEAATPDRGIDEHEQRAHKVVLDSAYQIAVIMILIIVKPVVYLAVIAHRYLIDGIDPQLIKLQLVNSLLLGRFGVFHGIIFFGKDNAPKRPISPHNVAKRIFNEKKSFQHDCLNLNRISR